MAQDIYIRVYIHKLYIDYDSPLTKDIHQDTDHQDTEFLEKTPGVS